MNFFGFKETTWTFLLVLIVLLLGIVVWLTLWVKGLLERRAFRRLMRRAKNLERQALQFLERQGFRCLQEQAERESFFLLNGRRIPFRVRVDYLLKRKGRRYIAEVKTGKQVESPENPSIRRQLLEYALLFAPCAVLFVDGEHEKVYEVSFPWLGSLPRTTRWMWIVCFSVGFLVGRWSRGW